MTIREAPWYRREAFVTGLRAAGYEVLLRHPDKARAGDVLCQWNRYGSNHSQATQFESEGGTVLIAENGYLGNGGVSPKFDVHPAGPRSDSYYALGLGFHNDSERVLTGPERWAGMGIELKPWRTTGDHVLVCPNRSFGVGNRVMPTDWAENVKRRLQRATKRPLRIRAHPGNDAPKRPLSEDLKGCWLVVIWSSSCGVHALAQGIPVICEAPHWILKGAASGGDVDTPDYPERLPHFEGLARGQFTCQEIAKGVPFGLLPAR